MVASTKFIFFILFPFKKDSPNSSKCCRGIRVSGVVVWRYPFMLLVEFDHRIVGQLVLPFNYKPLTRIKSGRNTKLVVDDS